MRDDWVFAGRLDFSVQVWMIVYLNEESISRRGKYLMGVGVPGAG
jgi:hypothetical protein